jgi:pimeloyl-ACP methyl ester carboxylesterase
MAESCRVVPYDPRGSRSSDPVPVDALPPWRSSAAELLAVMDAAEAKAILATPIGSR